MERGRESFRELLKERERGIVFRGGGERRCVSRLGSEAVEKSGEEWRRREKEKK